MNGENVQQNNLDNIYADQLAKQRLSEQKQRFDAEEKETKNNLAGKTAQMLNPITSTKKLSEHWLLLIGALLFDLIGLIPYVGLVTNPIFSLILFLALGSRAKGLKIAGGTLAGVIIESIPVINVLPTNLSNAIINIISK